MGTLAYLEPSELGALQELKRLLDLQVPLVDFCLYGSKARGTAVADSDLDVMVELDELTPEKYERVFDLVFDINLRHGVFISAVLFGRRELEEGAMAASPLFKAIVRDGVRL